MPHTGVIDESLEGEAALYMRAKLHVKGGLERFSDGMTADAIAAIYDAISSAMQRYLFLDDVRCDIQKEDGDDLSDDHVLFEVLLRSGCFDKNTTSRDFEIIEQALDDAFEDRLDSFDETSFLDISLDILRQLGIETEL